MPQAAAKIILFGLADDTAESPRKVLTGQGYCVFSYPFVSASHAMALIEQMKADCVFCAAEPEKYIPLLEEIRLKMEGLPLIVVSRLAETPEWLNALQAGASDFCAPPFEAASIQWILESARQSCRAA